MDEVFGKDRVDSAGSRECDRGYQIGVLFSGEFIEIWMRGQPRPPREAVPWEPSDRCLSPRLIERYPGLPLRVIVASLIAWTRLCGLILMEVSGHLAGVMADGGPLFEIELADLLGRLTGEAAAHVTAGLPAPRPV
jgi:hypothetical protein